MQAEMTQSLHTSNNNLQYSLPEGHLEPAYVPIFYGELKTKQKGADLLEGDWIRRVQLITLENRLVLVVQSILGCTDEHPLRPRQRSN